jgi:Na+-transporting methylmalonyl-CoA/oxaloacetate decarboxylase gamma subunit
VTEDLTYALSLTGIGLGIVFLVLAVIAVIVSLVRRADERWQERERERDVARLERDPTIDHTTAVVLAAAVATYLTGRYRIRSVRRLLPADAPTSPWSVQGRSVLQGSHVITKKTR